MATEKLIVELDADTDKFNRKMAAAARSSKDATNKITPGFNKVHKATEKTTEGVKRFNLSMAASAVSAALVTRKIIQYADAMTSITNKLKLATDSTEELTKVTNSLFDIANNTRASVTETVGLYSKLERSTRTLNLSQDRLLKITGSINKSFAIVGATTQESAGAIRQLGQAMQSGALRGEEYNSISEQAPIIMEAIRAATGKTAGELRKLAATGAITSDIIVESLERYASVIDNEFATSTATFAQKMEVAQNNTIKFVGANEELNKVIGITGDTIISLSNNIDVLITGGKIAVVLLGSRLAASLSAVAFEASLAALATLRTAGSLKSVSVMAGVAEFSTLKATKSITLMGRAAGTASKAMALLGGPVGVLITVVASLALFVDWETKAEKATKKANAAIDGQIDSLEGLTAAQLEAKNQEFARLSFNNAKAISEMTKEINKAKEAQEGLAKWTPEYSIGARRIVDMKEALQGLFEEQSRIQKLGTAVFNARLEPKLPTEGDKPLIEIGGGDAEKKRLEALEKQKLADEQELQSIIDRLKSEEELLNEQFEQEKQLFELRIEDKAIFTSEMNKLDVEYLDKLQKLKDKELKAEKALADEKDRIAQKEKRNKLRKLDDTARDIQAGMELNSLLFEDNKAIAAGLIVADTATAITKSLARNPHDWVNVALIAASGAASLSSALSASKGGGSIASSGGGGSGGSIDQGQGGLSDDQQAFQDTSALEVTEQSEAGTSTNTIRFDTDSGDQFLDILAGMLNESQRNGRT